MIDFFSSWAKQIIIAVLIAVIFEMILINKSKNTKYIKTVIGIYIVYTIIAPFLNLLGKNNIDFTKIDYESYFKTNEISSEIKTNIETLDIKEKYKENLENDFKQKIKEKGFEINDIAFEIVLDENDEEYGKIKSVELSLSRVVEDEKDNINVDKIKIGKNQKKSEKLSNAETDNLKKFINNEYGIEYDEILIK